MALKAFFVFITENMFKLCKSLKDKTNNKKKKNIQSKMEMFSSQSFLVYRVFLLS